jgi:hypothetical protein
MILDGGAQVLVTGRSQAGPESAQKEIGNDAVVVSTRNDITRGYSS